MARQAGLRFGFAESVSLQKAAEKTRNGRKVCCVPRKSVEVTQEIPLGV